jgi:hypothetical protein
MSNELSELANDMHWYDIELLKAYLLCNKSAYRLSRETKIPYSSILKRIAKLKENGKFVLINHPEYLKLK